MRSTGSGQLLHVAGRRGGVARLKRHRQSPLPFTSWSPELLPCLHTLRRAQLVDKSLVKSPGATHYARDQRVAKQVAHVFPTCRVPTAVRHPTAAA